MATFTNTTTEPVDTKTPKQLHLDGMEVWWLINRENADHARNTEVHYAVFPRGLLHGLHRHPDAEESYYVVRGTGLALGESNDVRVREGDMIHVPAGEWHGFANDNDDETHVLVFCGGVSHYSDGGYEEHPRLYKAGYLEPGASA